MLARWLIAVLSGTGAITIILAPAAPAAAHLGHVITRAERYIKIDAAPEETRVVVTLTLGAAEAPTVLRAADTSGDGVVSAAEGDAYLRQWGQGLLTDLPVTVDGEPAEIRWADPYLDPIGAVRGVPLTVEMVGHLTLSGGQHRLTITDRMRVEAVDRTDVAFRARDGAQLVASGLEPDVASRTPDLSFGRAERTARPRQLTAILELPATPADNTWIAYAAIPLALLAVAAAWLALRRRPRS